MSSFKWQGVLFNRLTGEFEDATLISPISERHLEDFDKKWKKMFDIRKQTALRNCESFEQANLQDAHWEYRKKIQNRTGKLSFNSFAIDCSNETQGLMIVKTTGFAREASQSRLPLVYIEYISTAPWNRIGFTQQPKYKGVGRFMLAAAISLSIDEGFDGRIGLHSLPQALSWYRDICEMIDLGQDSSYLDLNYLEMTAKIAKKFIK